MTGYAILEAKINELKADLPGISFGYIGNCGHNRRGTFDDRSWRVFLPGRWAVVNLDGYSDTVYLGSTERVLAFTEDAWPETERRIRRQYSSAVRVVKEAK